ncbi:MAG: substrate-binding domain-containing protein [Hyphomicrobiales bacterium]|nr:substrate-binding domain-containing protein [Hyphomicrobiales bacterium]
MSEETIINEGGGATVRVLSASAQRAALTACAETFATREPNIAIHFFWATSGAVTGRVEAGETYDIVAAARGALEALAEKWLVASDIHLTGISRIALGMRKGQTPPDIATPEKFAQALRAAKAFARGDPAGGGTAGNFLARMLERIGVLEETRDKSILRVGGYNVMREVAAGHADFGLTQSTEIVAVDGVEISAWLPEALQMDTVYALAAGPGQPAREAKAFLDFITGQQGRDIYKRSGFADV